MSISAGVERPWAAGGGISETLRAPAVTGTTYNGTVTAQTFPLSSISALALTPVTTVIYCTSILLPRNLPVYQMGILTSTASTVTGFWFALATQGGLVRAVSANAVADVAGYDNLSVLPANSIPYVSEYAGLYYFCWGIVTSVAGTVAGQITPTTATQYAGPPVYAGTSATAATTTPPALGASIGTIAGAIAGFPIYGQLA
jgi:hypothetical protein